MSARFQDLQIWKQGMRLGIRIHKATTTFPKSEMFGLTSQIRRSAYSIPSNIAEGKGRQTPKEFRSFLYHARGSLYELQTQIYFAQELGYWTKTESKDFLRDCSEIASGLTGLIHFLDSEIKKHSTKTGTKRSDDDYS